MVYVVRVRRFVILPVCISRQVQTKPLLHPGVVDVRGRPHFSRFDPLARRGPTLATLVRPRGEDLLLWRTKTFLHAFL